MLVRALTGFLPRDFRSWGTIKVGEETWTELPRDERRASVAASMAIIWQDSISGLNPCQRVGRQLGDTLLLHGESSRRTADADAREWIGRVGIERPRDIMFNYPHELSGGMRQRISLALGLCGGQPIVVADEPTTALDMIAQRACADLIDRLCREDGRSLIFISHDLALTAQLCGELLVLDHGRVIEAGPTLRVLHAPRDARVADLVTGTRRLRGHGVGS